MWQECTSSWNVNHPIYFKKLNSGSLHFTEINNILTLKVSPLSYGETVISWFECSPPGAQCTHQQRESLDGLMTMKIKWCSSHQHQIREVLREEWCPSLQCLSKHSKRRTTEAVVATQHITKTLTVHLTPICGPNHSSFTKKLGIHLFHLDCCTVFGKLANGNGRKWLIFRLQYSIWLTSEWKDSYREAEKCICRVLSSNEHQRFWNAFHS